MICVSEKKMCDTRTDDVFLLRFLRARKHDAALAFKMVT